MSGASDPPLATYIERLPQVRRVFQLYPDRVEVAARWTLGGSFRNTVKLADLSGQMTRFTVKNRWLPRAIMVGSCAVAFALVLSRPGYPELVRRAAVLGWPAAGVAFAVALLCLPRRRFVHFPRSNGNPGLDICQAGPDRARFEAYVEALRRGIRSS